VGARTVASHGEVRQLDGVRDVRTRGCACPRLALSNREEVAREDPCRTQGAPRGNAGRSARCAPWCPRRDVGPQNRV